jgi:uncharacterized HAD superfamily protein
MKPKVLLDIDGVIANFHKGFSIYLNEKHGCTLNPEEEPNTYSIKHWGGGIENIDTDTVTYKWIKDGGFGNLSPFSGAKEFVDRLNNICVVYVVTARIGDWDVKFSENITDKIKSDTQNWFKKYNIPVENLHFTHKKVEFCKENEISVLIEDKLETALNASKEGMHTILIDRNYNYSPAERFKIYRAYSYNDVFDYLSKLGIK